MVQRYCSGTGELGEYCPEPTYCAVLVDVYDVLQAIELHLGVEARKKMEPIM
jgi:hypothetical protein